ncbi:unnamed protein product [Schistosoma haematobium]|nr:unnamed protein product [Schistosoma haematobium]
MPLTQSDHKQNCLTHKGIFLVEKCDRFFQRKKLDYVDKALELFAEIMKFRSILKPCVMKLYKSCSFTLLPSLKSEFVFLFYVSLLGMETFGENGLGHFLLCIKVQYCKEILRFLCSPEVLRELKSEWIHVYDESFVDTFLIKPLVKWKPVFISLQKSLESEQSTPDHKKITEVQPFRLTQPKLRSILMPDIVIPKMQKMRDPPISTYNQPPEISLLLMEKNKNREQIEKLKIQSDRLKPKCAGIIYGDAKTTNNQNEYNFKNDSTDNIEDTRNNKSMMNPPVKLKSQRISSNKRKYLSALNKTAVVNTNAVSILREWKLYSDREREQRQKLCELESGAFTNAAYNSWKQEEEMKIKLNQLKKMECNRLNVMISHEASSTAKFDLCCKRKIAANKLRNEKHAKLLEFLNEKKLQQDKMNKVAKEVASSHENAKIAKKKLMEEKKKSASEILKESKQLLDEAAIKAEEEKKMKKELISQIQAEELSAIMTKSRNVKQIDLTNTPGHGLLNEMSIIELRERLNQSKINKQRELEEKRDAIINDKEQKTKVLLELLTRIGKHRSVKTVAATRKMVNNGENTLINNCKVTKEYIYKNDPSLQQMLDCLSKQKEERQRYAKSDQSQKFRKYVNKGVKNKENESLKTFWDELERQREQRSRMETGATHHPSEHLITSLTA